MKETVYEMTNSNLCHNLRSSANMLIGEEREMMASEIFIAANRIESLTAENAALKRQRVEVVRCKDCEYFYCMSAIDRNFHCKHPSGLHHVKAIEEDSFCSYGKPKEGNHAEIY